MLDKESQEAAARLVGRTIVEVTEARFDKRFDSLWDTSASVDDVLLVLDDGTLIMPMDPLVVRWSEVDDGES